MARVLPVTGLVMLVLDVRDVCSVMIPTCNCRFVVVPTYSRNATVEIVDYIVLIVQVVSRKRQFYSLTGHIVIQIRYPGCRWLCRMCWAAAVPPGRPESQIDHPMYTPACGVLPRDCRLSLKSLRFHR